MSSAIEFAVRTQAGGTTYGNVAGPDGSAFIQTGLGDSLSLNISPQAVLGYSRSGNDLLIELVDGRVITLADWFDAPPGMQNSLYLSSDGMITEVALADMGSGQLSPSYTFVAGGEKWSPLDDLRFGDGDPVVALAGTGQDEPAGMGLFIPALLGAGGAGIGTAALAGGGLLLAGAALGGGSGGDGTGDVPGGGGTPGGTPGSGGPTTPPHIRAIDGVGSTTTLTSNTANPAITVTGKGIPGDSVTVTIGTQTQTTTVGPNGTWTAGFTGPTLPADGTHTATATFTGSGSTATLTGPGFIIDMTPPDLRATQGFQSNGDIENLAEHADGVTLKGTTEPGATVNVTVGVPGTPGAITLPARVDANGNWDITFTQQQIPGGERNQTVTVTAADRLGNTRSITETVVLDTVPPVPAANAFARDNVVNFVESQGRLLLTGTAPADATRIEVQWLGQPVPARLTGNGTWEVEFPAGTATRTMDSTLTVTAWDAAGNMGQSQPRPIRIDLETAMTLTPEPVGADRILSGPEQSAGITVGGTAELGAQVFLSLNGTNYGPIPVSNTGTWTHTFTSANLAGLTHGSQVTLSAWSIDAAENRSATETRAFTVDTQVGNFTFAAPDLMGTVNDGPRDARVLNAAERGQGLLVTGTVEPGASVSLAWGNGKTHNIPGSATGNGEWSYRIPAADLPEGANTSVTVTATARDTLGNTATAQQTVAIDTVVANFNAADIRLGTGTDNILNVREHQQGLRVEGKAEADSTITVTLGNHSHTATANSSGDWFVNFTPNQIPTGERTGIPISVTATDTAGNTSGPFTKSFDVDTIAPNTPTVIAAEDVGDGLRRINMAPSPDQYSFFRVDPTGSAAPIAARKTPDPDFADDRFTFLNNQTVPDGSYLVINTRDAAGNAVNTLFINDTNSATTTVDLGREGLRGIELTAIDLTRLPDARLTITATQLEALTGPDRTLFIKGEADDVVTLSNVTKVEADQMIGNQRYDIYTLGDNGARVILEDDVTVLRNFAV